MRVRPTITWVTREATQDFTFDGLDISQGTTIHLFTESAGTDPRAVSDGRFDITAERPEHFGFGAGVHHCLGHYVARIDMATAMPILAQRLRDPEIDGEARFLPDSANTGAIALPIRFSAAPAPN
jgi:cytochrome P450